MMPAGGRGSQGGETYGVRAGLRLTRNQSTRFIVFGEWFNIIEDLANFLIFLFLPFLCGDAVVVMDGLVERICSARQRGRCR
jgi:hypothetical protein